jgi:hypothetical protein
MEASMAYEKTPDGGYAESMDETHSQPQFLGRLALVLLILAVLFALTVIIAGVTHGG